MRSRIEEEICSITGVSKAPNEPDEAYRARLIRRASELDDDGWEALTDEAQDWVNSSICDGKLVKPIPDFPDVIEDVSDSNDHDDGEPKQVTIEVDDNKTLEPFPPKPPKMRYVGKKPKYSATERAKMLFLESRMKMSAKEALNRLAAEGFTYKETSLSVIKSDLRKTIQVMKDLNVDLNDF